MKIIAIFIMLLLSACNFSSAKGHNTLVRGGSTHEDNIEAAKIVGEKVWNGRLRSLIKDEVIELRNKNLDQMLGIKFQDMRFSGGEKGAYIQCVFKSSEVDDISNKVIDLCKAEVGIELSNYFDSITSNKEIQPTPNGAG